MTTLHIITIATVILSRKIRLSYTLTGHSLFTSHNSRQRRTIDCSGFRYNRLHQSVLQPLDFTLLAQGHNAPNLVYCLRVCIYSIIGYDVRYSYIIYVCRGMHRMIRSRRTDLTNVQFYYHYNFILFLGHHTSWTVTVIALCT